MDFKNIDDFMGMSNSNYIKLELDKMYMVKLTSIDTKEGKFGKQLEYSIIVDGSEKRFCSSSKRLWFALKQEQIGLGDTFEITKSGIGTATQWEVKKLDVPNDQTAVANHKQIVEEKPNDTDTSINLDDIPF